VANAKFKTGEERARAENAIKARDPRADPNGVSYLKMQSVMRMIVLKVMYENGIDVLPASHCHLTLECMNCEFEYARSRISAGQQALHGGIASCNLKSLEFKLRFFQLAKSNERTASRVTRQSVEVRRTLWSRRLSENLVPLTEYFLNEKNRGQLTLSAT